MRLETLDLVNTSKELIKLFPNKKIIHLTHSLGGVPTKTLNVEVDSPTLKQVLDEIAKADSTRAKDVWRRLAALNGDWRTNLWTPASAFNIP